MEMALNQTASGKYRFDAVYFNRSISKWVNMVNTDISITKKIKKIHIYPGKYGFDSYVYILSLLLTHLSNNTNDIYTYISGSLDINNYLLLVHKGWKKNYIYWVNDQPYNEGPYKKPTKELNTDTRNEKAMLYYNKLDEDTKNIYKDIISSIFKILSNEIIEDGIKNLKI